MNKKYDVVIVGSGPNGLSAGTLLAEKGLKVLIIESSDTVGGGTRTAELTLPGFHHDVCSAVHPMGYLSPYFKTLPLEKFGLEWIIPDASVAHPLDKEDAVILSKSVGETARNLGIDASNYEKLMAPFVKNAEGLLADSMKPLGFPKNPLLMTKFGLKAMQSASFYSKHAFKGERAKALFAGCAAHSILPFDKLFTTAIGLMFLVTGHVENWAIPKGGSQNIAKSLAAYFENLGGEFKFSAKIENFKQLPLAKKYIFDTDPLQLATIAEEQLPVSYQKKLKKFRFGPGVFKIDYALNNSIPWRDSNCLKASTVHLGNTFNEIALSEKDAWEGRHSKKPLVLIAQQSQFDSTRAPKGKHTGWAYCHVPNGSTVDMTPFIESQIERFAPGFKSTVLAKHTMMSNDFHGYNPNYVGGAIAGGAADVFQLFSRPVNFFNPYSTPNPNIFICSASSPPGGGVHGMCGFHAAQSVLKSLDIK